MILSPRKLVYCGNLMLLWMILNTFITDSIGINLVIIALLIGALQYVRVPQIHHNKISPAIQDLFEIDEHNLKKSTIFHKAGGWHAPENTLEAVQEAINLGIPAVEIDLDFTSDGIGVLIHGPKVDDTTDASGFVSDFTFEGIRKLNAAATFRNKDKFRDVRIPTLEACVELCISNGVVVFIDCKSNPKQTAALVASLYQKHPELYGLGIVCSFYPSIIYAVRQADSNILTGLTHRDYILTLLGDGTERNLEFWKRVISPPLDWFLSWAHWSFLWYICGNSFFLSNKDKISLESKKFWDSLGIKTLAWTVNDQLEKEFLLKSLGVPIITDGLDRSEGGHS